MDGAAAWSLYSSGGSGAPTQSEAFHPGRGRPATIAASTTRYLSQASNSNLRRDAAARKAAILHLSQLPLHCGTQQSLQKEIPFGTHPSSASPQQENKHRPVHHHDVHRL